MLVSHESGDQFNVEYGIERQTLPEFNFILIQIVTKWPRQKSAHHMIDMLATKGISEFTSNLNHDGKKTVSKMDFAIGLIHAVILCTSQWETLIKTLIWPLDNKPFSDNVWTRTLTPYGASGPHVIEVHVFRWHYSSLKPLVIHWIPILVAAVKPCHCLLQHYIQLISNTISWIMSVFVSNWVIHYAKTDIFVNNVQRLTALKVLTREKLLSCICQVQTLRLEQDNYFKCTFLNDIFE